MPRKRKRNEIAWKRRLQAVNGIRPDGVWRHSNKVGRKSSNAVEITGIEPDDYEVELKKFHFLKI